MAKGDLWAASPFGHGESPPQGHRTLRVCVWRTPCWAPVLPYRLRSPPGGGLGVTAAQGRGSGAMGRRTVSLNCPVLCLKGTSPDGSQVTGQSCERSTQPAPLGLPPCPQASVGHGLLSQPLRGLTLNARLCSDCAQTVPAPTAFHQGSWDHASWVDFEELRSCGFLRGEASALFPRSSPRGQDCGESQGQGPRLARRPCPQGGQRGSGFGVPRVRVRGPPTGVLSVPACASSVGRPATLTRTLLRGKGPSWNDDAQHRGTWDGGRPRQQGGQSRLSLGVQVPRRGVDGNEVLWGREGGSWDQALRSRLGGGWVAAGRPGARLLGC